MLWFLCTSGGILLVQLHTHTFCHLYSTSSCTPIFTEHAFFFLVIIKCAALLLQQLVKISKSWPTLHADLKVKTPLSLFSEPQNSAYCILGAFNLHQIYVSKNVFVCLENAADILSRNLNWKVKIVKDIFSWKYVSPLENCLHKYFLNWSEITPIYYFCLLFVYVYDNSLWAPGIISQLQ